MTRAPERFPRALLLAVAAALFAIWSSGLAAPVATGLLAASWIWAAVREWRGRRPGPAAERLTAWASLAYMAVFAADLLLTRNLLYASLRLLVFLTVVRLLGGRTDRERMQLLLLSFLAVVAATASSTHLGFAIPLATYTAAALWALACRQADTHAPPSRPRPGPTLRRAFEVLALGLVIFFLIPHVGTGYFRPAGQVRQQVSGFSGRVELGSINRIKRNHDIVMRIRMLAPRPETAAPLRWRGRTFDTFDGRSWSRDEADTIWMRPGRQGIRLAEATPDLYYEVILEPIESRAIFAAPVPVRLEGLPEIGADGDDGLSLRFLRRGRLRYRAASRLRSTLRLDGGLEGAGRDYPRAIRARYLQLPPLDPGVIALAGELAGPESDPYRMARLVEEALQTRWTYSLDVRDRGVADPVARFLLEGSPGHCEYFATAMALLLRARGVPTRLVTGFLQGTFSDLHGTLLVRQSDAHSWVEVYFPGQGWVGFDPTPRLPEPEGRTFLAGLRRYLERVEVAWDTWIVGLDLNDQAAVLGSLQDGAAALAARTAAAVGGLFRTVSRRRWGPAVSLAAAALLAGVVLLRIGGRLAGWRPRRRTGSRHEVEELYRRFLEILARRGLRRPPHLTPLEFARQAAGPSGRPEEVAELTAIFCRGRYGGHPPSGADLRRAEELLRTLRRAPGITPPPAPGRAGPARREGRRPGS